MKRTITVIAAVLAVSGTLLVAQGSRSPEALFKAAQHTEEVQGDLKSAIEQYKKVVQAGNRALAAQALLRMADCYRKLGDGESRKIYEQLVRDFSDQADAVATARTRLATISAPTSHNVKVARQVWTGHGVDAGGSFTADGRFLTFTDWDSGDLAVRDLAAGTNRRLTNTGGWVGSGDYSDLSVISPDGRQVIYGWFVEKEFKNEVRVLPLSSSGLSSPRTVLRTERPDYIVPVGWMPDGNHVVVLRSLPDKTNQIGMLTVQDGGYRSIKSLEWRYPNKVSVSPDGRYIAYDVPAAENGSPFDIMVLGTDGSGETRVVQDPANDTRPVWSPDGTRLVFLSDRTGSTSLWSIAMQDGRASQPASLISGDIGRVQLMGITRSGALYYNVPGSTRQNIYVADVDQASASVRGVRLATERFVNSNFGPSWSRDGRWLAYYSNRSPVTLAIRNVATGVEHDIDLPRGTVSVFGTSPRWFPDHHSVLIVTRDPQGAGRSFYRVDTESGKAEAIWHPTRLNFSSFDLSPDGRSIFCAIQNDEQPKDSPRGTGRLVRYDIAEHREVVLARDDWFITVAVSPDGKQLASLKSVREDTSSYPGVIEIRATDGGGPHLVYEDAGWIGGSRYNALTWTADQKSLVFAREGDHDETILWRVPVTGGGREPLGVTLSGRIKAPSFSPDGKQIIFAVNEADSSEIWTLENFLSQATGKTQ